jgi:transposase-like protein
MEAAVAAYEREGARLAAAARGVDVVAAALRGERWVPRL